MSFRPRDLMWDGWEDCLPGPRSTEEPDSQETTKLAFCPLLLLATGAGMCGDVRCGSCAFLLQAFEGKQVYWLCSDCSRGGRSHPYWTDGACNACGFESSVLVLTEV